MTDINHVLETFTGSAGPLDGTMPDTGPIWYAGSDMQRNGAGFGIDASSSADCMAGFDSSTLAMVSPFFIEIVFTVGDTIPGHVDGDTAIKINLNPIGRGDSFEITVYMNDSSEQFSYKAPYGDFLYFDASCGPGDVITLRTEVDDDGAYRMTRNGVLIASGTDSSPAGSNGTTDLWITLNPEPGPTVTKIDQFRYGSTDGAAPPEPPPEGPGGPLFWFDFVGTHEAA